MRLQSLSSSMRFLLTLFSIQNSFLWFLRTSRCAPFNPWEEHAVGVLIGRFEATKTRDPKSEEFGDVASISKKEITLPSPIVMNEAGWALAVIPSRSKKEGLKQARELRRFSNPIIQTRSRGEIPYVDALALIANYVARTEDLKVLKELDPKYSRVSKGLGMASTDVSTIMRKVQNEDEAFLMVLDVLKNLGRVKSADGRPLLDPTGNSLNLNLEYWRFCLEKKALQLVNTMVNSRENYQTFLEDLFKDKEVVQIITNHMVEASESMIEEFGFQPTLEDCFLSSSNSQHFASIFKELHPEPWKTFFPQVTEKVFKAFEKGFYSNNAPILPFKSIIELGQVPELFKDLSSYYPDESSKLLGNGLISLFACDTFTQPVEVNYWSGKLWLMAYYLIEGLMRGSFLSFPKVFEKEISESFLKEKISRFREATALFRRYKEVSNLLSNKTFNTRTVRVNEVFKKINQVVMSDWYTDHVRESRQLRIETMKYLERIQDERNAQIKIETNRANHDRMDIDSQNIRTLAINRWALSPFYYYYTQALLFYSHVLMQEASVEMDVVQKSFKN